MEVIRNGYRGAYFNKVNICTFLSTSSHRREAPAVNNENQQFCQVEPNLRKTLQIITLITEIENKLNNHNHDKYITTPEFHTLAADAFNARLANLVTKTIFDNTVSSLNSKITANRTIN